ncbi:hypothetical protein PC116_g34282, partial [Phytophthora cactorum]
MLGDEVVSADEAKDGIDKGLYVVVGETTPTFTPPPPPAVTSSSSSKTDGVFIQKVTASSASPSSAPPTTTSSAPAATSSSSSSSGYPTGIDAEFPDGKIKCDHFPEEYGAVPLNWLGLGGWSGLQFTPSYKFGDFSISFIETGVKGMSKKTGFYSYACPEGYVKTQWPSAQGST